MGLRARDGTTRRGGARPRPPGPAPSPWPAAPPPRGVPGRSSPQRRPHAARGRREYSRGRPVGRPPRGRGGAAGPREGCGARPASAGVDEVRVLDRVALRGPPRLDRLRSRPGGCRHKSGAELLPREAGVGCLWRLCRKPEKSCDCSPQGGLRACPGNEDGYQCLGANSSLLSTGYTGDSACLRESPLRGFSPALFVQWPRLSEKGALGIERSNPLSQDYKAGS